MIDTEEGKCRKYSLLLCCSSVRVKPDSIKSDLEKRPRPESLNQNHLDQNERKYVHGRAASDRACILYAPRSQINHPSDCQQFISMHLVCLCHIKHVCFSGQVDMSLYSRLRLCLSVPCLSPLELCFLGLSTCCN